MSIKAEIVQAFIDKLLMIIHKPVAIYTFTRKISNFDKWLKDKEGLVIILDKSDFTHENFIFIDLIYDKIQDEFGWQGGVQFANLFSRGYIRTLANLWHINMQNPKCLLPEDQLNLLENGKLVYGEDILKSAKFPHNKREILEINVGLTRREAENIALEFSKFQPLIKPETCWNRHDFTIKHSVSSIIEEDIIKIHKDIKTNTFAYIYGRQGGSGKTQIMYSLISKSKELNLPFIYRSEFWKDESGKYMENESNPENEPKRVVDWLIEKIKWEKFVLFLDEVNFDYYYFEKQLSNKFPNSNLLYHIIEGGKDYPKNSVEKFEIFDISKEYSFADSELIEIISSLVEQSSLRDILNRDVIEYIAKKTQLWNISTIRKTPTAVVLTANLALIDAIKYSMTNNSEILITKELIEKWGLLGTSPWYQKYGEIHDVHAEYFVFDGKEYTEIDRHYKHYLP